MSSSDHETRKRDFADHEQPYEGTIGPDDASLELPP
jgi:hypothetical protein